MRYSASDPGEPGVRWIPYGCAAWFVMMFLVNLHYGVGEAIYHAMASLFFPGILVVVFLWCLAGPLWQRMKK